MKQTFRVWLVHEKGILPSENVEASEEEQRYAHPGNPEEDRAADCRVPAGAHNQQLHLSHSPAQGQAQRCYLLALERGFQVQRECGMAGTDQAPHC